MWDVQLHVDSAAYHAIDLSQQPNFGPRGTFNTAQALPTVAVKLNWPLIRDAGGWGSQIIEPIIQLVAAPRGSTYRRTLIPNEDSLDQDFTDGHMRPIGKIVGFYDAENCQV